LLKPKKKKKKKVAALEKTAFLSAGKISGLFPWKIHVASERSSR